MDCNQFVDELWSQEFKCGVCLKVMVKPVTTQCKHTFCFNCLTDWVSKKGRKRCPQTKCKTSLSATKKSINPLIGSNDDNNAITIDNNIVVHMNDTIDDIISDLKIRCHYHWNGCPEVLTVKTMKNHMNECEHKTCQSCGLSVGLRAEDHDCDESERHETENSLLRFKNTELRIKCQKMAKKFKRNEEKYKQLVQYKHNIRTCLSMTAETDSSAIISLISFLTNDSPKHTLNDEIIRFGTYRTNSRVIEFYSNKLFIKHIPPNCDQKKPNYNIMIPYKDIDYLFYSKDSSLLGLIVIPTQQSCLKIQQVLKVSPKSPNGLIFDVNSKVSDERMILIELKASLSDHLLDTIKSGAKRDNNNFHYLTINQKNLA